MSATPTALRGTLVWCDDDPFLVGEAKAFRHESDGLVIVQDGKITAAGSYDKLKSELPTGTEVTDYRGHLIAPGFIDTHIHFVQTGHHRRAGQAIAGLAGSLHLSG